MNKKVSVFLCAIMATSMALTSCAEHKHTFSESWASDATNHWHAATCEHGEEKDSLGAHVDADEDGKCDVCAYEVGHTHTYASEWSTDETSHWHAATCTHTDEKSDLSLHVDADTNGECDVCKGHVHVVNVAGICTICGKQTPIDEENIATVIAAVAAQYNSVVSGEVNASVKSTVQSDVDEEGNAWHRTNTTNVKYTLGESATFVDRTTSSTSYYVPEDPFTYGEHVNRWYYVVGEVVEGVEETIIEEGDNYLQKIDASADDLCGYTYAVSTLASGKSAEAILAALYELSQAESASDYEVVSNTNENTYMFSFNSLIVNTDVAEGEAPAVRYYETLVAFSYSDRYVLTDLVIACDAYTNDPGSDSAGNILEADVDYDYDPATGTITMRENADPDVYSFVVKQVEGTRTYVNEMDITEYYPESFSFSVDGVAIENNAKLTYNPGDNVTIEFLALPETSNYDLVRNDVAVNLVCDNESSNSFAWISPGYIDIYSIKAGNYTLTFSYFNKVIFTVTIEVVPPVVTGPSITVTLTDTYGWFDTASFTATEAGDYTFTLPAGYGAYDIDACNDWGDPYVDFYDDGGSFTVTLAAGETYEFYVGGLVKGDFTIAWSYAA